MMRTGLVGNIKSDGGLSIKHLVASLCAALVAGSDEPKTRSLEDGIPSCPEGLTNIWSLTNDLTLLWDVKYGDTPKSDVLRVCMESQSSGWLGFGVSPRGMMIGSQAIIGLPDEDTVLKYDLGGKSVSAVLEIDAVNQTLMNAIIKQKDNVTVMFFEKYLQEDFILELGQNNSFIFADATGNALGYHGTSRGNLTLLLEEAPTPTCPSLPNSRNLTDTLILFYDVVLDETTNKNKICVCMESESEGWLGFGISPNSTMIGSDAVIGLPNDGIVLKYTLNGKTKSDVIPMNPADQTLMDTRIQQRHGVTVLSFEKFLDDERHQIVLGDNNTFIFAQSSNGNNLGYHGKSRGSFTLFLDAPEDAPNGPESKSGKQAKSKASKKKEI